MKKVLTIAGSDSGGGAGIQADIKTMTMNGVFAMSVITVLTAQNTIGVQGIFEVSPEFIDKQLDSVFSDLQPDAVKIGMVFSLPVAKTIANYLVRYHVKHVVVDPVMVATSGAKLIDESVIDSISHCLFPLADLLTPNIPEAEVLCGSSIISIEDMERAACKIGEKFDTAVLIKGGHALSDANDILYKNGKTQWFYGKRIENNNVHGTGCTLSSAIAANLAKGFDMTDAVERAKDYISGALNFKLDLGSGSGPIAHNFDLTGRFAEKMFL